MAQGNNDYRSEYDIDNEYEEPNNSKKSGSPTVAPARVPRSSINTFRPRNLPIPAIYIPTLGGRRRQRRDAEDHIRSLQIANQVAGAAEALEQGIAKLVEASQQREMAEERRVQIPARIELENLEIGEQVLQRRADFANAARRQQDEDVKHERLREIKTEDFAISMHKKRAERLEAEARAKAAEEYLAHAAEIGRRKAETDRNKAAQTAFETEADAEAQHRRRDQERHRRSQAAASGEPEMPEALARHYATERKVQESQKTAQERAAAIRRRAQAENRELTDDEVEEIDALLNAAAGAEGDIRRGDATDFTV